jgi:hypothetical protein
LQNSCIALEISKQVTSYIVLVSECVEGFVCPCSYYYMYWSGLFIDEGSN